MILDRGLIISLLCHLSIIGFMIVKLSFFSKPDLLLSEAIRVDMVGLPDKYNPQASISDLPEKIEKPAEVTTTETSVKEPEPVAETPPTEKIENPKPTEKANLEKKDPAKDSIKLEKAKLDKAKQKQKDAFEKLKKLSAIDKIRQQVQTESNQQKAAQALKGRVLSKGTALTGIDRLQSENYLLQIDGLIKSNWQLPQWLIGKPLKTKILVKIASNGQVIDKKVTQSSGNPTYDEYCLLAIEKASPFPQVPEKFTEIYSNDGVLFGFPE